MRVGGRVLPDLEQQLFLDRPHDLLALLVCGSVRPQPTTRSGSGSAPAGVGWDVKRKGSRSVGAALVELDLLRFEWEGSHRWKACMVQSELYRIPVKDLLLEFIWWEWAWGQTCMVTDMSFPGAVFPCSCVDQGTPSEPTTCFQGVQWTTLSYIGPY